MKEFTLTPKEFASAGWYALGISRYVLLGLSVTETTASSTTYWYYYNYENTRVLRHDTEYVHIPNRYYRAYGADQQNFIYAGPTLIATLKDNWTTQSLHYNHSDHLGSSSVTTDINGDIEQTIDYDPFGNQRLNDTSSYDSTYKYTGHEYDTDTDLTYMKARYYTDEGRRFLAQDPAALYTPTRFLEDPQQQNLYSYTANNPLKYVDPSGESAVAAVAVLAARAIIVGYVGGLASQYVSDVAVNLRSGETGGKVFAPQSSLNEYVLSGGEGSLLAVSGQFGGVQGAGIAATGLSALESYSETGTVDPISAITSGVIEVATGKMISSTSQLPGVDVSTFSKLFFTGRNAMRVVQEEGVGAGVDYIASLADFKGVINNIAQGVTSTVKNLFNREPENIGDSDK